MDRILIAALLFAGAAAPAPAQRASEYRAPTEPVYWVSDNPFHLHLVRGGDTIGAPVRAVSVFRESWRPVADGYDVERASTDIGFRGDRRTDTLTVNRAGRVLRVNGGAEYDRGEWDALLRLPAAPLVVGLVWADTLAHPANGPLPGLYEVHRVYRAERRLEAGDVAGFEVVATGTIRFHLSFWTDSVAGHYRWFELDGPVEERFVFDPATGQLHRREWSMLLEGIGGDFDGHVSDTVPAALRSANTRYRIPGARATSLTAPLPGADSSATVGEDGDALALHTLGRDAAQLVESRSHPDGAVVRATVRLGEAGRPTSWSFEWVEPGSDARSLAFETADDVLATAARRLDPPAAAWGVAEHGMSGTLIPSLQALPDVQETPFAIYRPTAATWDVVAVGKHTLPDVTLYLLTTSSGAQTALLVDPDGLLLFEEADGDDGTVRMRVPTSAARSAQLERVIASLRGS